MKKVTILGVEIDDISRSEALAEVGNLMLDSSQHYITTPNPEIVLRARKDKELRAIINHSDLALPDGFGLKLGAKILGQELANRVAGADFMIDVVKLAAKEGWSVFLLGGDRGVAEPAASRLKSFFPQLIVVGSASGGEVREENGEWTASDNNLVENINSSGAQILFVGFGCPKQEKWLYDNLAKLESVKLAMTVGGSLDYLAGTIKRAPLKWRQAGLEWVWRLLREPKRVKRIWNAVVAFLYQTLRWRVRMAYKYRPNVLGLIVNDHNQVLLIQEVVQKYDHWQLPQGGVEPGENLEQAVLREMREEIGTDKFKILGQHPRQFSYVWPRWHQTLHGRHGQKQTIFYLQFMGSESDIKLAPDEVRDYKWVGIDDAVMTVYDKRKEATRMAVEGFKKLQVTSYKLQNFS